MRRARGHPREQRGLRRGGAGRDGEGREARRQLEVNFFAPAALMQAVMPLMRKQRSGRIVNISSVAGRFGYPLFGWYCASKHALEGSPIRSARGRPWGFHVSLIEPGPSRRSSST